MNLRGRLHLRARWFEAWSPLGIAALAIALTLTSACGSGSESAELDSSGSEPTSVPEANERSGSLLLALTTPDGATFEAFQYAITGPNFAKAGSIDVSESNRVSALIEGISAASGYSLTLAGSSTAPVSAECSGSAPFSISAGTVTEVDVAIACHASDVVTPSTPAAVPLPPLAPAALGLILLVGGSVVARRRRGSAGRRR